MLCDNEKPNKSALIGLNLMKTDQFDHAEQLRLFKSVGFNAFFSCYPWHNTEQLKRLAEELGMEYQSIHAPFGRMNHMWESSPETESTKQELMDCVAECAKYGVPIMVAHPFIGFGKNSPTELGIKNFKEVVDYALKLKVKVAFENVEGEAYLQALMEEFKEYPNVGFCWDTGHEMCYNRFKDMLALYGDRLIATHINDNLGVSGEEITFQDDLHLIPFDGVKDWPDAISRLKKCGYNDILTFELKIDEGVDIKAGTNYHNMDFADYVKSVYDRAKRLQKMLCDS